MHFDWDPDKQRANLRKHGIELADAVAVFRDPLAVTVEDSAHDEQRFVTMGLDALGRLPPCVRIEVLSPLGGLCDDGGITEAGPAGRRGSAGKEPVGRLDGGPPAGAARGPGHLRRRRA